MDLNFDDFALREGVMAEDFSSVIDMDADPVRREAGPRVRLSLIERLYRDRPRTLWVDESLVERRDLIRRGWASEHGVLTHVGRAMNADLGYPAVQATLYRRTTDSLSSGSLLVGRECALATVTHSDDPPDGGDDPTNPLVRFQSMDADAVPLFLARWARLGPAWSFPTDHRPLEMSSVIKRLDDPDRPVPRGADEAFAAMWAEPWMQWGVVSADGSIDLHCIQAGRRGQYRVTFVDEGRVRLVARPSSLIWGDLVRVTAGRRRSSGLEGWSG